MIKFFSKVLLISFLITGIPASVYTQAQEMVESIYEDLEIFANTLMIVKRHYVEAVSSKDLIYGSLQGMLASLDPHSQFMLPDEYKEIREETEGRFGGIGIEITIREGVLTVITPVIGGPAAEQDVAPGDLIVKIDGESTRDLNLSEAVKKLRGKPGSNVKLTLLREETSQVIDVEIRRDIIQVQSVRDAKMLTDHIAYVRIADFQETTYQDLTQALQKFDSESMKGLILDLRNNRGGLLDAAVAVCEEFLPEGTLVVKTKSRDSSQNEEFRVHRVSSNPDYPIVVLINKGSASASEIVAGALQSHRRGIIVGTTSFGKGSVQTVIPMADGSAVRLTTSYYYTPDDHKIHGKGIIPDVQVDASNKPAAEPHSEKEIENKENRIYKQLLVPSEEIQKDEIQHLREEDVQLDRAIDILTALNVYRSPS